VSHPAILKRGPGHGDHLAVLWPRRDRATLDDVVELLHGLGVILQQVDAMFERIVWLLEEDDDDETRS
jgi:hypothetical protein